MPTAADSRKHRSAESGQHEPRRQSGSKFSVSDCEAGRVRYPASEAVRRMEAKRWIWLAPTFSVWWPAARCCNWGRVRVKLGRAHKHQLHFNSGCSSAEKTGYVLSNKFWESSCGFRWLWMTPVREGAAWLASPSSCTQAPGVLASRLPRLPLAKNAMMRQARGLSNLTLLGDRSYCHSPFSSSREPEPCFRAGSHTQPAPREIDKLGFQK